MAFLKSGQFEYTTNSSHHSQCNGNQLTINVTNGNYYTHMHTHTHACTHVHTHIHTHAHTHIHTHTHTHTYTHIHTHTRTHIIMETLHYYILAIHNYI